MAGSNLIQNQQDSSVTEVHKSLSCSAKVSNCLLFWLDQHPLPFIFCMLLTLPEAWDRDCLAQLLVQLWYYNKYFELSTCYWGCPSCKGNANVFMVRRYRTFSDKTVPVKRKKPSPLCSVTTPQQVDSKCVCMCWACCLIATNQLVLLLGSKPSASGTCV